ncbi:geranylgeranylglycerol-phosphate geranylgeranyltransferase [Polaribacter sp. SA4-10]|uniref:geranylgeranylglycerol-phosphate geranylgeranyltransferase n=1 Tax=Polaribacter sp. SA4-10 TaxID=754397 RepID=UPI0012FB0377|nr:geranylgeranylglycerol-phosphate geranylgeranyltransferase [Polaribacter sp. SA4-10]
MVFLTMVLTKYALIHSITTNSYLSNFEFLILVLSVISITAGGYIVNDIFDIETDKINKPANVFIDATLSKKNAWICYFLLTFLGIILGIYSSFLNENLFFSFIFIGSILGLFFYSKYFKKQLLFGNLLVSVFVGLSIFILILFEFDTQTNSSTANVKNAFKLLFPFLFVSGYSFFAFLTTLVREIIKDIEDIKGDLKIKARTLPIVIGRKRASKVAFFFSSILLVFLLIVLQFLKNELLFLSYGIVFILLPLLYFMYELWFSETKKEYSKLSHILKIIMLLGILSMLLFKIN